MTFNQETAPGQWVKLTDEHFYFAGDGTETVKVERMSAALAGHATVADAIKFVRVEATRYFVTDAHGSTRTLAVMNGIVIERYDYNAYGEAIGFEASGALTTYQYSGEQFDAHTGFQYLRARYYDPSNGRFTRMDPFFGDINNPLSLHKYGYVHASPIMGIDPTGESLLIDVLARVKVLAFQLTIRATNLTFTAKTLAAAHPVAALIVGVVASSFVPEEVEDALIGTPQIKGFGVSVQAAGRARRRVFASVIDYLNARGGLGDRARDFADAAKRLDVEQSRYRLREGVAAARYEAATGHVLIPGKNRGEDAIDEFGNIIQFKGPVLNEYGQFVPQLNAWDPGSFANSVIKDLKFRPSTDILVVDLLGFSASQADDITKSVLNEQNNTTLNRLVRFIR